MISSLGSAFAKAMARQSSTALWLDAISGVEPEYFHRLRSMEPNSTLLDLYVKPFPL
jgi:hypothetical protein